METTLLSGPGHAWLVVGSNGAIGSELTRALLRSSYFDSSRHLDVRLHPRVNYAQASIDMLLGLPCSNQLRLLFCAGKGGFSLAEASADQQYQAFEKFCQLLTRSVGLDKFVFVSSLGAHCSRLGAPYSQLIRSNEETVLTKFCDRSLILRMPSLYGYNDQANRYHGLIGVILQNLKICRPTGIYTRLETRRNYLSIRRLAAQLVRDQPGGALLEANGILNIQSSINLTVFDVCASIFRTAKQRPILKMIQHSPVDAEHHCPSALYGAKVIINDPISEWVSWQWNRSVHLFPS
jgi:hypothetical protein